MSCKLTKFSSASSGRGFENGSSAEEEQEVEARGKERGIFWIVDS